jgi:hypothetical protein
MNLLIMQRRLQIMAQQGKEGCYSERFIAVPQHLPINCVIVELVGYQGDDGVHGYHEQDADNVLLLPRARVVSCVEEHEGEGNEGRDDGENGCQEEPKVVEGEAPPEGNFFLDCRSMSVLHFCSCVYSERRCLQC